MILCHDHCSRAFYSGEPVRQLWKWRCLFCGFSLLCLGAQVRDLRTQARVFQNNRCSACQAPLDLPAVHFLCMHSFHQRCLGDNERECVKCAPENRTVMEIKRSLEASAADQARGRAERGVRGTPCACAGALRDVDDG